MTVDTPGDWNAVECEMLAHHNKHNRNVKAWTTRPDLATITLTSEDGDKPGDHWSTHFITRAVVLWCVPANLGLELRCTKMPVVWRMQRRREREREREINLYPVIDTPSSSPSLKKTQRERSFLSRKKVTFFSRTTEVVKPHGNTSLSKALNDGRGSSSMLVIEDCLARM